MSKRLSQTRGKFIELVEVLLAGVHFHGECEGLGFSSSTGWTFLLDLCESLVKEVIMNRTMKRILKPVPLAPAPAYRCWKHGSIGQNVMVITIPQSPSGEPARESVYCARCYDDEIGRRLGRLEPILLQRAHEI